MAGTRAGKHYGGPWYSRFSDLAIFELAAREHFPALVARNQRKGKRTWREYQVEIQVPTYEKRNIMIKIFPNKYASPLVISDGPTDSPHRYSDGSLCMWCPHDPKEMRWTFEDGLLHLLVLIQAHLFREAWWRETGEWLGPEVSHGEIHGDSV